MLCPLGSWRHWSKFCVSHGGFGAMAPAPLLTVTNSRTFYATVSHKLSRVTLSQSLLNSISQLQLTQSHQTRSFTRTWQVSHMQSSRRPGYRPQHESAKTKKLTVNRGQRSRKRPIEGQFLHTKRTTENTSGTDCYTTVYSLGKWETGIPHPDGDL